MRKDNGEGKWILNYVYFLKSSFTDSKQSHYSFTTTFKACFSQTRDYKIKPTSTDYQYF